MITEYRHMEIMNKVKTTALHYTEAMLTSLSYELFFSVILAFYA